MEIFNVHKRDNWLCAEERQETVKYNKYTSFTSHDKTTGERITYSPIEIVQSQFNIHNIIQAAKVGRSAYGLSWEGQLESN